MDFRDICDVFGGTVFYDDLRKSPAAVRIDLDRRRNDAYLVSLDNAASLLLLEVVWNLHSSNIRQAYDQLACLTENSWYGLRWAFRAHVYCAMVGTWREYPRAFKAMDLASPAKITWRARIHHPKDKFDDCMEFCQQHNSDMSFLDSTEYVIIKEICQVDKVLRERARRLNTQSNDHADYAHQHQVYLEMLNQAMTKLQGLSRVTAQIGLPAISAFICKTIYDLAHISGIPNTWQILERMWITYDSSDDDIGRGYYWLIRGDYNISTPFTTVCALNFEIADAADEFGGDSRMFHATSEYPAEARQCTPQTQPDMAKLQDNSSKINPSPKLWTRLSHRFNSLRASRSSRRQHEVSPNKSSTPTKQEPELCLQDDEDLVPAEMSLPRKATLARQCYNEAERYFAKANCSRGTATVALRRACSVIMLHEQPDNLWTLFQPSQIREDLGSAWNSAQTAGDVQLRELVEMYQLLQGHMSTIDIRDRSQKLGQSTEKRQDEVFGLCLALLALRNSYYCRYIVGSFNRAMATSEISRQIIKSMAVFKVVWVQTMVAQISMRASVGLTHRAVHWAGFLKKQWYSMAWECIAPSPGSTEATYSTTTSERGLVIAQHYFKMAVVASISADATFVDASSFPDSDLQDILSRIEQMGGGDDVTARWLASQRNRIKYHKAIRYSKRHRERGEMGEANKALQGFLADPEVRQDDSLQTMVYRVDAAMIYGLKDEAKALLSRIDDGTTLPEEYIVIGRRPSYESKLYTERRQLKSLELIFICCIRVGEWSRAGYLMKLLENASPGYFTSASSYTKLWPWNRCLLAGLVLEKTHRPKEADLYYLEALQFFHDVQRLVWDPEDRRLMWQSPDVARLVGSLARRAVLWKDDVPGEPDISSLPFICGAGVNMSVFNLFSFKIEYGKDVHQEQALLFLEIGRGHYVVGAHPFAANNTEGVEALYRNRKWVLLQSKLNRTAAEEQELQELGQPLDDVLIAEAEASLWNAQSPESQTSVQFGELLPFTPQQLMETIPTNAIAIFTTVTEDGLAVLVVDHSGIKVAFLVPELSPAETHVLIQGFLDEILEREIKDHGPLKFGLMNKLLSNLIMQAPVVRCIAARDHVIFLPSGQMARVPFGALIYNDNYLILQKQVSQVPSLSALRHLRLRNHESSTSVAATNAGNPFRVIARPGSVADQRLTHHSPLPMAGIEALMIAHLFNTTAVNACNVSRSEFQDHLRAAQILHLGTHGYVDDDYAFNSRILLRDYFRVLDMLNVRTDVFLVVFSACLSGLGHASDLGDVQGFSHAFLRAGANAYLGALWKVNDIATMLHMFTFYWVLFVQLDKPSLAEAWHMATCLMYSYTTEQTIGILRSFITYWDIWEANGEAPGIFVRNGRKRLGQTIRHLQTDEGAASLNFKQPYFWASFVMVGNASLQVHSPRHEKIKEIIKQRGGARGKKT